MLKLAHRHSGGGGKALFVPSATAFQEVRRTSSAISPSESSSFGDHSTDSGSISKDDSDSDCTCDVECSSNLEDSGLFSCDGEVESIIAPPSPFVTRSHIDQMKRKMKNKPPDGCPTSPFPLNHPYSTAPIPSSTLGSHSQIHTHAQQKLLQPLKSPDQSGMDRSDVTSDPGGVDEKPPIHSTTIYVDGAPVQRQPQVQSVGRKHNKALKEEGDVKPEKGKADKNDKNQRKDANASVGQQSHPQGSTENESMTKQKNPPESEPRSPITYPAVIPPVCKSCTRKEVTFFDPSCSSCWAIFQKEETSPSHVFAVLRLWVPQIQKCVARLVRIALALGCGVHDRDAVTDMTLVHYAVKSGSTGIGNSVTAYQVVAELLDMGADLHQRCKWTSMTALHYAAYFDVPRVLDLILQYPDGVSTDDPCLEYNNGTSLHIAAANLSEGAVRVLLSHGASPSCRDNLGRLPIECIPSCEQYELVPDLQELIFRLHDLLDPERVAEHNSPINPEEGPAKGIWGKAILQAIGLKIGDRVLISGVKTGILRYAGPTEFATGLWAGVELETPQGRHNGTVKGVVYFRCSKNYGIFVPVNRLTKIPNVSGHRTSGGREGRRRRIFVDTEVRRESRESSITGGPRRSLSLPPGKVNHGRVDISKIGSRIAQDIRNSERKLEVEDKVCVDMGLDSGGSRIALGVVRFTGPVHFASGYWIGVELDEPRGSHDGSVCGTRYFSCGRSCGIFAAPSRISKIDNDDPKSSLKYLRHRQRSSSRPNRRNDSSSRQRDSSPQFTPNYSFKMSSSLTDSFSSTSSTSSSPLLLGEETYVPLVLPGIGHSMQSLKTSFYPTNTSMSNLNKCFSGRYIRSRQRQEETARRREEKKKEPRWEEPPSMHDVVANRKPQKENPHWLQVGHTVFYRNKCGMVRYIGPVHFSEGIWLGLELRERRGRNNGIVNGKRYFTCKRGHGVMVPPNKVTVHGLNGELLVKFDDFEMKDDYSYEDISV